MAGGFTTVRVTTEVRDALKAMTMVGTVDDTIARLIAHYLDSDAPTPAEVDQLAKIGWS